MEPGGNVHRARACGEVRQRISPNYHDPHMLKVSHKKLRKRAQFPLHLNSVEQTAKTNISESDRNLTPCNDFNIGLLKKHKSFIRCHQRSCLTRFWKIIKKFSWWLYFRPFPVSLLKVKLKNAKLLIVVAIWYGAKHCKHCSTFHADLSENFKQVTLLWLFHVGLLKIRNGINCMKKFINMKTV
jgi:hypothetical protein